MQATKLTTVAGESLNPVGTPSGSPQTDAYYIRWHSAPGAGSVAGEVGPFTQTQSRYRPVFSALIRTGSSIASQRIWVALTSANLSQTDGTGALATRYIGLRFSTAAGDTTWHLASGDGTTGSAQDSGITVQANTAYLITLDWSIDGQLDCQINGISCALKTTNLDTVTESNAGNTDLGVECGSTALGSPAVDDFTSYISLRYNGNNF